MCSHPSSYSDRHHQNMDAKLSILMIFTTICIAESTHNYLCTRIEYYAITLFVGFFLGIVIRPPPYFLTGALAALALSFFFYTQYSKQFMSAREGCLVIFHALSLPGAYIGLMTSAVLCKKYNSIGHLTASIFSALSTLTGLAINQAIVILITH